MSAPELREPQQERSRASLERVIQAGIEVLEERGYEGFTIAEVSRRAHVSIGAIYGRFANKDALFQVVHERETERVIAGHAEFGEPGRWENMEIDVLITSMVREVGGMFHRNAQLLRISLGRAMVDEVVRARGAYVAADLSAYWQALLLARRDELSHPDPELAAEVSFRIVQGVFMRWMSHSDYDAPRPDWDDLVDELAVACTAYLLKS